MSFRTKLFLTNKKFTQESTDNLNLSGNTYIDGALQINSGGTFTLKDGNESINKILYSDINGKGVWGSLPEIERVEKTIVQTSHGFQVGDFIGWSNGQYSKAIADSTYDGEFIGFVSKVTDVNTFTLTQSGFMTGFTGLVGDSTYYLSDVTAGEIMSAKTEVVGHIVKPVLIATDVVSGWVLPYIGSYVVETGDTFTFTGSVYQSGTTITLVNDELNPSGNSYYGTDENGVKGWHELPDPTIDVATVTGSYNVTLDDDMIAVDTSGGVATINLPTTGLEAGKKYYIKDSVGNAYYNPITVDAGSGFDIDGDQSGIINTNYGSVELIYIGNNKWNVVSFTN